MHTFVILAAVIAAFLVSLLLVVRKALPLERTILFAIVIFGFFTNVITLPGLVPDEPSHIETAYRYANLWLGKPYAVEPEEGVEVYWEHKPILVRKADIAITDLHPYHEPTWSGFQTVKENFRWFCTAEDSEMVITYHARDVECGFMGYLFSSLGMALGRVLHLGMYPMLYLGRIANLAFYALCIFWALRLMPVKKWMLGLMSLTPMCMQLVCSYSYDAPILGMSFLVIAWGLRLVYQTQRLTRRDWLLSCLFAFLLIPSKMTICPFLPMLLIPSAKCGGKGKKALLLIAVLFSGLAGFLPQYADMLTTYLSGAKEMVSDTQNQRSQNLYTLGWILNHPKETVQIFLHTIRQNFSFYWTNMLGGRLAVFQPVADWSLMLLGALMLSSVHDPEDAVILPMKHRLLYLAAFVITFLTAMFLMMFMWTPVGSEIIEGVQGRYFLPAMPLLFLFLGMESVTLSDKAKRWITVLVLTLNTAAWAELLMWIRSHP